MPFLCYYLQVHDCIIAIMGSLSGIEEDLVTAFATRGWHMYFGLLMSGLRCRQRQSFDRVKFDVVAGVAARPPPQYLASVSQSPSWGRYSPSLRPSQHWSGWSWATPAPRWSPSLVRLRLSYYFSCTKRSCTPYSSRHGCCFWFPYICRSFEWYHLFVYIYLNATES